MRSIRWKNQAAIRGGPLCRDSSEDPCRVRLTLIEWWPFGRLSCVVALPHRGRFQGESKFSTSFPQGIRVLCGLHLGCPSLLQGQNRNDKIRVAVIGMGGRANSHARSLIALEQDPEVGVEFAGVCDCDQSKLAQAVKSWSDRAGHPVRGYDDMRRVLDDDSIDGVAFATPNHWHSWE